MLVEIIMRRWAVEGRGRKICCCEQGWGASKASRVKMRRGETDASSSML